MPTNPNKLSQFWQELKRRKVLRVITVYAAVAFVILQLVEILAPSLRLPDWTMNLILVLLIVGFIITVIVSWVYDVTPEGIEKTKPAHKLKVEEKAISSNSWKIASYISFVVIVTLIVLNIIPRTKRSGITEILDKSIAVLPFKNDSPNQERMYFINGTMEAILDNLCKIEDLRVPGRTSVEQYRDNPKPIPTISQEMNVSYILEGSGFRDGNNIRLVVQLLDGRKDQHLWSKTYDSDIEEIFSVQSEIAQLVAAEIEAIITPEEKQLIEKIPTTNVTAYDFCQRGIEAIFGGDGKESLDRAEELYHKALQYDSTFAQAYAGLALVYWYKHRWEEYLEEDYMDSMLILADIALSFDDQLAEAYAIRGRYYEVHNRKAEAINEYNKAIQSNPNYFASYWRKGNLYLNDDLVKSLDNFHKAALLQRGQFLPDRYRELFLAYAYAGFKEKAIYNAEEALNLDDDSATYYSNLATIEDGIGNYEKAIELYRKSYAIDSTQWRVIFKLGENHSFLGQFEESLEYMRKCTSRLWRINRSYSNNSYRIGYAYLVNGFQEEGEYYINEGLEMIKRLIELGRDTYHNLYIYYNLAAIYSFLGDKEKAYETLRLLNQRQRMPLWAASYIKDDPMFESIRDESEFQQILAEVEAKYKAEHERVRKWLEENEML